MKRRPTRGTGPRRSTRGRRIPAPAEAKQGITDQKVVLGAPTRVEVEGTSAYVIVPATYTFTQKGVAMRAVSQMTVALKKGAGGWLIHGWTWTGPKPTRGSAAKVAAITPSRSHRAAAR